MGRKRHKVRKHQNDPGDSLSSGEDSQQDCSVKTCPHISKSVNLQGVKKVLKNNVCIGGCQTCAKSGNDSEQEAFEATYWLCLQCGNIGCGRSSPGQHALQHYKTPRSSCHATCLNIATWSVWCYECDEGILSDSSKKLLECVEFLKRHMKPFSAMSPLPVLSSDGVCELDLRLVKESAVVNGIVCDKDAERSSVPRSALPVKPAPNKLSAANAALMPKGLMNLGNTCFFNAVMQSLSQTHMLSQLLDQYCIKVDGVTLPALHSKGREGTSGSAETDTLTIIISEGGPLTQSLSAFLKEMHSTGKTRNVNPGRLFGQICAKAPMFRSMNQQDSHELLRHLLDGIKSEEIRRYKSGILKAFGLTEKSNPKIVDDDKKAKVKAYGKAVPQTVVDRLFSGQLISTVFCEECKMSSQVFEPFLDLSLPVTEEKPVRPSAGKRVVDDDDCTSCFRRPTEKLNRKEERRMKKQSRREAKIQRSKAQQSRLQPTAPDADVNGTPKGRLPVEEESCHAGDDDADSKTNSTKTNSELSDADVEDNAESESMSSLVNQSLAASAPAMVGGKNLNEDPWSPQDVFAVPSRATDASVAELCRQVKGVHIRHDSLPNENGIGTSSGDDDDGSNSSVEAVVGSHDDTTTLDDSFHVNGDVAKDHETEEEGDDTDGEMWSGRGCTNRSQSMAKPWVTKSVTTLAPRYQPSSHECSVLSCLYQFTASEMLAGNNKFGCEHCTRRKRAEEEETSSSVSSEAKKSGTVYTNASKQLLVFSPPAILTLHLKRFQQVGYSLRKVNRHVDFSLLLDLAPFCSSVSLGLPTLKKCQNKVLYSLYAVVEHSGRLYGGHYTAYVKVKPRRDTLLNFLNDDVTGCDNPGQLMEEMHKKMLLENGGERPECARQATDAENGDFTAGSWFHISDGHVSETSEQSVLKCQAYLLFYERVV